MGKSKNKRLAELANQTFQKLNNDDGFQEPKDSAALVDCIQRDDTEGFIKEFETMKQRYLDQKDKYEKIKDVAELRERAKK